MLKQRGMALLLVLMITTIISVVITVQQYTIRSTLNLAQQAKDFVAARAIIESTKEELIFQLSTSLLWLYGPSPELSIKSGFPEMTNFYGKSFEYNDVTVTLTDLSGLTAVLPFNEAAWRGLLAYGGATNIDNIIAALKDWYDEDDFLHLNGAEKRDYKQPGLPRNDLPQSIAELALVKGMTPSVWGKISPYLAYISGDQLNADFVPEETLEVMMGEYRAGLARDARKNWQDVNKAIDRQSGEQSTFYPSNRLKVEMTSRVNNAAYHISFVLIRVNGTERITQIAERKIEYSKVVSN